MLVSWLHSVASPVSLETPAPEGPLHWGQSAACSTGLSSNRTMTNVLIKFMSDFDDWPAAGISIIAITPKANDTTLRER